MTCKVASSFLKHLCMFISSFCVSFLNMCFKQGQIHAMQDKGSFSLILALKIKSMCFFVCVIVGFICICYLNNVAFFINKVLQLLPLGEGRKVLEKHKTTPKSFIFRDLKLQNKTTLTVYIIRWQETICITCKLKLCS